MDIFIYRTSYAIWTGIGTVGSVILGIFLFKEPASVTRIFFICLIITGIVGLKITSPKEIGLLFQLRLS
jgi:quaternary ammonium compound-resistance protein SugE